MLGVFKFLKFFRFKMINREGIKKKDLILKNMRDFER